MNAIDDLQSLKQDGFFFLRMVYVPHTGTGDFYVVLHEHHSHKELVDYCEQMKGKLWVPFHVPLEIIAIKYSQETRRYLFMSSSHTDDVVKLIGPTIMKRYVHQALTELHPYLTEMDVPVIEVERKSELGLTKDFVNSFRKYRLYDGILCVHG